MEWAKDKTADLIIGLIAYSVAITIITYVAIAKAISLGLRYLSSQQLP